MIHVRRWAITALLATAATACGPELTTPSPTDISGAWASSDTALGVTDFLLELSQATDGAITGSWSGRGIESNGACPTELGCTPRNDVKGWNTVFQVHIDLVGAGAFTGQIETEPRIRGHLSGSELTFNRVGLIQGARLSRGSP